MPDDEIIKVCVDMVLDEDEANEAVRAAVEERLDNLPIMDITPGEPPQPAQLAVLTRKLWQPGRDLRVGFMDGNPQVQAKVEQVAKTWEQFANIEFHFGTDPESEIRVSFTPGGSWSYMGTDAKTRPINEPTLSLGWLTRDTPDVEYDRVVLHEFGHALGCIHEHQSPAIEIPWDKPAVYRYYAQFGWDQAKVDFNVFEKYSESQTQFTEFDPESIMVYPIPNEHTIGDFEIEWRRALSDSDKNFIELVYPFESTPTVQLEVGAAPVEADIGQHGEEDSFRFVVAATGNYTIETGGRTDVKMGLFGPDDRENQLAKDDDSGRGLNAKISMELQPGMYHLRIQHFRPTGTGKYTLSVVEDSQ